MKKMKYRGIAFLMAMLLFFNATPIWGAENTTVDSAVASYMSARTFALAFGKAEVLDSCSVVGIVNDEREHYEALKAEKINVIASSYEIIAKEGDEIEVEVELEETIHYLQNWKFGSEVVYHTISVIYDDENVPVVVSDSYYEECSEFVSASYVNPYAVFLVDAGGSDECIIRVAENEIGYLEKASNASLDDKEANAGNANYTKYGKWFGNNGVAWCSIFVSWCANQANVSTSIIKKTASCDTSMNFFKNAGLFQKSKAYGGTYTPKAGDIFFYGPKSTDATHTGIVVEADATYVTVIHGNSTVNGQDQVRKSKYSLTNTKLLGFGTPAYESDNHSYTWKTDEDYHYRTCAACGYETSKVAHSYLLKSDATNHWYECDGCGLIKERTTHSYAYVTNGSQHSGTCTVCKHNTGWTNHNINYSYHATYHWGSCSQCGYSVGQTGHTHSYVSNAQGHYSKCSVCNYNYGTTLTAHTYKWESNITNHWKVCSVCGYKTATTAHTWKDMGTYSQCSQCGKTQIKQNIKLALAAQ